MSRLSHSEIHMVHRIGWLRAAVLGANDGLVSTSSLVVGVAAAGSGKPEVLIAGLAGLVAGATAAKAGVFKGLLVGLLAFKKAGVVALAGTRRHDLEAVQPKDSGRRKRQRVIVIASFAGTR